jgi:hypothetical protein
MRPPSTLPTIAPIEVVLVDWIVGADEGDDDVNFRPCRVAKAMEKVVVAEGFAARSEEYVSFMRVAFRLAIGFSAVAQQMFVFPVAEVMLVAEKVAL